jgi:hypothetical protein
MFEWFKRPDYKNVVPMFPDQVPYVEELKPEELYYTIGITSEDRVALKIGYSTLTMNKKSCEDLIEQLNVFVKQLTQKEEDA